jgi:asparagine synthase (glutamine-hydrolysing)
MLEGVERLVDLVGFRASGLTGASNQEVQSAVQRLDLARLAATDGHFACVAAPVDVGSEAVRQGRTVRLARTIAWPLRYFVAKMYHGPFLVVSDRIDSLFAWCDEQRIGWQFDPAYTRMVPAHHVVEIDQVGCPDPVPRYHRFFEPAVGSAPADLDAIGAAYIGAARRSLSGWLAGVPADAAVGVAFSGGIDSTAVLLLARQACRDLGRDPDLVRAFTLDLGGGVDATQAASVIAELGLQSSWERVTASPAEYDLEAAIRVIEDYHPLDVECAAASLCLLRGIRARHPQVRHLLDGDGGDENLKSYPLEDSDLTLSSVLRNPMLYQEGWGIDAVKHSLAYSGGLSRGYVRTHAPAAAVGFEAFSPFTTRAAIAAALAMPFDRLLGGDADRLTTLKQDVVVRGIAATLGVRMPVRAKRRFQDGLHATPGPRVTKAWCRRVFDRQWRERLAVVDGPDRRSGNEMPAASGAVPVRVSRSPVQALPV